MQFFRAALFSLATISTAASFTPTIVAADVPQTRIIGSSFNSLFFHTEAFQNVPMWLDLMAKADGGKRIAAQGTFDVRSNNPPNWNMTWLPHVPSLGFNLGRPTPWGTVDRVNMTDMVIVTDNFSGPPTYGDNGGNPRVAGPVPIPNAADWVSEITNSIIVPFETNLNDDPIYWIYEGWADGGGVLSEDGSASNRKFAEWRDRTTEGFGYSAWFDALAAALQEDTPEAADRIKVIPVARMMVSVMENTAASALEPTDWFEDDAPHGTATLYLLASMVVYSSFFEEQPPKPDFNGTRVNAVFQDNYDSIAAHIFENM